MPVPKKKAQKQPPKAAPQIEREENPEADFDINNQSLKQRKIRFATGTDALLIAEIMKDCRTNIESIIDPDKEWKTLVNAMTLEIEAELIRRVVIYIGDIKAGKLHEQG